MNRPLVVMNGLSRKSLKLCHADPARARRTVVPANEHFEDSFRICWRNTALEQRVVAPDADAQDPAAAFLCVDDHFAEPTIVPSHEEGEAFLLASSETRITSSNKVDHGKGVFMGRQRRQAKSSKFRTLPVRNLAYPLHSLPPFMEQPVTNHGGLMHSTSWYYHRNQERSSLMKNETLPHRIATINRQPSTVKLSTRIMQSESLPRHRLA